MARRRGVVLGLFLCLAVAGFTALGLWQLQRRAWKLDLIDRVEARLAAAPVAAPGPADWPGLTRAANEYARVTVSGRYLHDRAVAVTAATVRGSGYWILTPLEGPGFTVLVNRGFVPPARRDPAARPGSLTPGIITVSGLLRLSEPDGGFLRANEPQAGRWYSRDVAAIAAAEDLPPPVAPYFIDAEAAPDPAALPVGGLTVVRFRNTHLTYALTWFALAGGTAWLGARAFRRSG